MTAAQIVGLIIILLPFVLIFGWVWYEEGFLVAAGAFAVAGALIACCFGGAYLLVGE